METRGFEPLTPALQTRCSPVELRPQVKTSLEAVNKVIRQGSNLPESPLEGFLPLTGLIDLPMLGCTQTFEVSLDHAGVEPAPRVRAHRGTDPLIRSYIVRIARPN